MRQTSGSIYEQTVPMTGAGPVHNDFFFKYEQNKKKKCSRGAAKWCGISLVIIGMNSLSFYMGFLLSRIEDSSESI